MVIDDVRKLRGYHHHRHHHNQIRLLNNRQNVAVQIEERKEN